MTLEYRTAQSFGNLFAFRFPRFPFCFLYFYFPSPLHLPQSDVPCITGHANSWLKLIFYSCFFPSSFFFPSSLRRIIVGRACCTRIAIPIFRSNFCTRNLIFRRFEMRGVNSTNAVVFFCPPTTLKFNPLSYGVESHSWTKINKQADCVLGTRFNF